MESDLDKLSSFIENALSTQSIVGSMVEVMDVSDYAFVGNALRYRRRENDSDKSSDSEEPMDEYISSI